MNWRSHDDLLACRRDIASCPWTTQHHWEKWSNPKLRSSAWVNDGTLRGTTDFASTLRNVDNGKISDLLVFLVKFLFSSHFPTRKSSAEIYKTMKIPMGGIFFDDLKKSLVGAFFPFSRATLQKHTWMATFLWSYHFQLVRKSNKLVAEQVK